MAKKPTINPADFRPIEDPATPSLPGFTPPSAPGTPPPTAEQRRAEALTRQRNAIQAKECAIAKALATILGGTLSRNEAPDLAGYLVDQDPDTVYFRLTDLEGTRFDVSVKTRQRIR